MQKSKRIINLVIKEKMNFNKYHNTILLVLLSFYLHLEQFFILTLSYISQFCKTLFLDLEISFNI